MTTGRSEMLGAARLSDLYAALDRAISNDLGFPGATDLDVTPLLPLLGRLLNNVGDPYGPVGPYRMHTKAFEREVVDALADLFRAPPDDRWGYVTSGSTEGTLCALRYARRRLPTALLFRSSAAHYSVPKAAELLGLPDVPVAVDGGDEIDYADLTRRVRRHRRWQHRPVIVVASVGTTMTEAIDDVGRIDMALDEAGLGPHERWIHADAALSGVPLALLSPNRRPGLDFADGASSIVVSGHKFLGCPVPSGVLLMRDSLRGPAGAAVDYTGSLDGTISGSRSGHAALMLWWAMRSWGFDGLRRRAAESRSLARYAVRRLTDVGWPAWRHRHALTVVLDRPPAAVLERWPLATSGDRSHIVCMPGKTRDQVDRLVADLAHVVTARMLGGTALPDSLPLAGRHIQVPTRTVDRVGD